MFDFLSAKFCPGRRYIFNGYDASSSVQAKEHYKQAAQEKKRVYYVLSDPHGYYSQVKEALDKAGFFAETRPHKVIVCGDALDRGKEAKELIEFMLQLADQYKLIYVLGNHEQLFVECLHQIASGGVYKIAGGMSHHYTNGTWDTMLQISGMDEMSAYKNPNELVRRILSSDFYRILLRICVDYYETPNYIFTHGWIPCCVQQTETSVKHTYDPNWRGADEQQWYNARWFNGMDMACKYHITEPGKTIVCGHWHTSYGHAHIDHSCSEWGKDADFSPFKADGILAIDACTAASGQVNCIVIED